MKKLRFLLISLATLFPYLPARGADLAIRYQKISCAVVRVDFDGGSGTGFFVNDSGRMVTVAHVLFDRKYRITEPNLVAVDTTPRTGLKIEFPAGSETPLNLPAKKPEDSARALFDLAAIETGLKTPCYIPLGDADSVKVGQNLICVGFPGSAASTQVLYQGFLASRASRLPLPFGTIENAPQLSYAPHYEVLRIQMPITPGASGSPVISDADSVVGVVSEVPVIMTQDVSRIAEAFGGLKNVSSGVSLSGFDVTKTLGELAWMVGQFETPGAGLAVPVSDLGEPSWIQQDSARPAASSHQKRKGAARQ